MMRNLGGSLGTSMISTVATHREHYHFSVIAERVTRNGRVGQHGCNSLRRPRAPGSPGPARANIENSALTQLANLVRREAYTMAYADCFFGIGVIVLLSTAALLFVPKPRVEAAAVA